MLQGLVDWTLHFYLYWGLHEFWCSSYLHGIEGAFPPNGGLKNVRYSCHVAACLSLPDLSSSFLNWHRGNWLIYLLNSCISHSLHHKLYHTHTHHINYTTHHTTHTHTHSLLSRYHQKYLLRQQRDILKALNLTDEELVTSHAAARLNGYCGGYGSKVELEKELPSFNLPTNIQDRVRNIVARGSMH